MLLQREEHLSTPLPTIFSESIMAKDVDDITTTRPLILLNLTQRNLHSPNTIAKSIMIITPNSQHFFSNNNISQFNKIL